MDLAWLKSKAKFFEWFILGTIVYSVASYFLESEYSASAQEQDFWLWSERFIAIVFTIEYIVRWIASRSLTYPFRMLAIIDLLAVLPFYLGMLVDLRMLRLVRTFRILRLLKLYRYTQAVDHILNAFRKVRYEFGIVGLAVFMVVWFSSVTLFELERQAQPEAFGNLSDAVWFVLITLSTVGYGDMFPVTPLGKLVTLFILVAGLALFGTFISLIGSAFVEEIRETVRKQEVDAKPEWPAEIQSMTRESFDPLAILKATEGRADQNGENGQPIRLLREACFMLLEDAPKK